MNKIFNSPFESGLRSLLLLYSIKPSSASIDRLTAYDFITIYSHDFGIGESNLHGDNKFNFSELATRRSNCNAGVKDFALNGLISISRTNSGFMYSISNSGKKYVDTLSSEYAEQYKTIAAKVHEKYKGKTDEEIISLINSKALQELRR